MVKFHPGPGKIRCHVGTHLHCSADAGACVCVWPEKTSHMRTEFKFKDKDLFSKCSSAHYPQM